MPKASVARVASWVAAVAGTFPSGQKWRIREQVKGPAVGIRVGGNLECVLSSPGGPGARRN